MNAVEMIDIVKEYPGVLANDHVSLTVREGEIHGLVGENGAGKSTIMNQLYGMQRPTSGTIRVLATSPMIFEPGRCPPIPGFAPCPILISMAAPALR